MSLIEIQDSTLICRVHNNYMEAVVGNEIIQSQAPSNNAQKYVERKSHKEKLLKVQDMGIEYSI